ncbi:uncharacterized protein LOC143335388 isoform X2 [Chaetodon auriga]|uniref:uncharacterized protein LOC143335388 isoform X2 n=1 Tax=Chaetodon auriga TaxID=39042 RepID=UPI004032E172
MVSLYFVSWCLSSYSNLPRWRSIESGTTRMRNSPERYSRAVKELPPIHVNEFTLMEGTDCSQSGDSSAQTGPITGFHLRVTCSVDHIHEVQYTWEHSLALQLSQKDTDT